MKLLRFICFYGLFLLLSINANATTKEGHLKYQLTYEGTTDEGKEIAFFMPKMTLHIYFNKQSTKVVTEIGEFMKMTFISNRTSDDLLMLSESADECKGLVTTNKELEAFNATEDSLAGEKEPLQIEYLKETKVIFGYTCKSARTIDPATNVEAIYWYTEELNLGSFDGTALKSPIPGQIMGFETEAVGVKTIMELVDFDKSKVDKLQFNMTVPKSCTKVDTFKEFYKF